MADQLSVVTPRDCAAQRLLAAILVNIAMGTIYAWGVFMLPLETYLAVSRAELSIVPTVALIGFTMGMVLHDRLLRFLGRVKHSVFAFALTGGGFLLFAALPGYWSLLVGYGALFGLGSGLGYGLALALASAASAQNRPATIGITVAAFASSGIAMPLALAKFTTSHSVAHVFAYVALAIFAIGACATALLGERQKEEGHAEKRDAPPASGVAMSGWNFIRLAIIFFCICFVGLMTISQLAGIVSSHALDALVGYSLSILTLGYLVGSLFGGYAARSLGSWRALLLASAVTALGLIFLSLATPASALVGAACIGATFGSSASLMPTLIGELYGSERIGEIYGRLMISYGLAGLAGPWGSGVLYDTFGGYGPAVMTGLVACTISAVLAVSFRKLS
ncbi:hypothetical protein QV13_06840 [Mesorhizobium hungaricum]|jgi:MFS transporter, OFA family, oxalate/formate antiporter|uniref:Major facilitator superfamily (MFS) profile domain-containing protein n=1 Tax=Mesorhizobium hungaricum TaxID=1566387 RepID=A0A1C2E386_9HYPH|nr:MULTISPECIES: MFS transporter [Mesorhizobium]MBN9235702.1 MFS transporter [Mesorhizobium sp.]OCX21376.1 hypothetical protein QV13_06840 [Mesorhizobium hungaricum]